MTLLQRLDERVKSTLIFVYKQYKTEARRQLARISINTGNIVESSFIFRGVIMKTYANCLMAVAEYLID